MPAQYVSRRARPLRAAISVALILIALLAGLHPQAQAQRRARAETLPSPDEAIVQARQAVAKGLRDRVAALQSAVPEAHLLQAYLPYWDLRLRLADDRGARDPSALDADAQAFIKRHGSTLVSDLLRRDWLLSLGKRREWAAFDLWYPGWALRDDSRVFCLAGQSALARGQALPEEAANALAETRNLGAECGDLLEALASAGIFKQADLTRRLYEGIEDNAPDTIRRTGLLLGLDAASIDTALNRPAKGIEAKAGSELPVIALSRLARQDVDAAVRRLEDPGLALTPAQTSFAWSQIAAAAMRKLMPEALDWTRKAMALAPSQPPYHGESLSWMLRAALRAQDWKLVSQLYARLPTDMKTDPTWVYWQGRALKAARKTDEAQALWKGIAGQPHFYGQLAAEELGQLTVFPREAWKPSEAEIQEAARNPGFARALKFYDLGLRPEGNREWNYQLRGMNDRQLLSAAQYACQKSILDRCVNTADRTVSEHDWSLRFLTPFREALVKEAQERDLDPAWVYGLIRQESRFLMDARSSVGASGLMQIMPATGRWIARKLGVNDFKPEQLGDMQLNLRFGTFYLKSVLDDLDGSPVMASAAYNAGPNRPRQWRVNLPGPVEGAIFAEIVPFTETRDYVKKVLSNATFYAAMFTGKPQSLKARLGQVAPKAQAPSELP